MAISVLDSPLYGRLFGDEALAAVFSDAQMVARMIRFEAVLAEAQGAHGVIPKEAAGAIASALSGALIDPLDLAEATGSAGVPVPGLVAALRKHIPDGHAHWLHWGATSQDVVDTATILGLQEAFSVLSARLERLVAGMRTESSAHEATVMAARTRGQIATPITFGLRIAQWAQPLLAVQAQDLSPLMRVQFGGASGANSAIAPHGQTVAEGLAVALGLQAGPPWHTDRTPVLTMTEWCCSITRALAKMAEDMTLMMRPEIAELSAGQGGGSSTMPQKSNPVGPEAILTLAHLAETAKAGLAIPHREERDGAAWAVEWALVPQIVIATGAALRHGQGLIDTMAADADRMRANLEAHPGVMAEAASFALARHMPREAAQALVKAALADDRPFADALAVLGPEGLQWADILSPDQVVAPCRAVIDQILG